MNVTELARRLRINTKDLLDILPEYGFDIGKRAIKIDDRTAQQVMRQWRRIKRDLDRKKQEEIEERKRKERELRKEHGEEVELPDILTVRSFAERMGLSVTQVITELMKNGILANQNQNIDHDTASIIAEELGFTVKKDEENDVDEEKEEELQEELAEALSQAENKEARAPVYVIMGHVDHGKTTLLDTIRKADIAAGEAGGITQHIGAYQTLWKDPKTADERLLTFIDTPGHEAFTVMRSRGATAADIAILIVAADDGVKPQTKEAIQIMKAAKIPFVVAINKIDKEGADVQRVKTELSQFDIVPEEWGGNAPMVEISAKNNQNIDKLLDMLLLVADVNQDDIMADPLMAAVGTVIESHVDKAMGPVATILVQSGTLHARDPLTINGEIYGNVRAMKDHTGETIETAGPSVPVQVIGLKVAPEVGDILDNSKAEHAEKIDVKQKKTQQTGAVRHTVHEAPSDDSEEEGMRTVNVLIKSDVLGSLEAILGSLDKLQHEEVGVKVVGKGLGNITEDDVKKAEAGDATIIGFNVKTTPVAEEKMQESGVSYQHYDVIYDLIDWLHDEMEQRLATEKITHELGRLKVMAIFRTDKRAMTIGGRVEEGHIAVPSRARIKRGGEIIGEGKITELQSGKEQVKKVPSGNECGVRFEGRIVIEEDDVLEVYTTEEKERKLELESK